MSEEREALARVIAETRYRWMRGQGDGRTGAETVADAVIAAGWRRSPQPADPRVAEIRARNSLGPDHCVAGTKLPKRGPCPRCGADFDGECKFYGVALQQNEADIAYLLSLIPGGER